MKRYRIHLKCLSPVHVGTGAVLDPFEYVIRERRLHVLDPASAIQSLAAGEAQQFARMIDQQKIAEARKLYSEKVNLQAAGVVRYQCAVSDDVVNEYRQKLSQIDNQLEIRSFPHCPDTGRPLLPGSSLKGAIRTAYLDAIGLNKRAKIPVAKFNRNGARAERQFILKSDSLDEDPFRCLVLRDGLFPADSTEVVKVLNEGTSQTRRQRGSAIPMRYEVVQAGTELELDCLLQDQFHGKRFQVKVYGEKKERSLSNPFQMKDLIDACNRFFPSRMKKEHENFYTKWQTARSHSEKLLKEAEKIGSNGKECLVRLGRFCHVECVRFSNEVLDFQGVRTTGGKSRNLVEGTTPLGWVRLRFEEV